MTKKKAESLKRSRTAFEWAILIVAVAAIVSMIVSLGLYAITLESGPPDLRVEVAPDGQHENRFIVRVSNRGGTTAEDVIVEVTSGEGSHHIEFDSVPKGGAEESLVETPGSSPPSVRIEAYKEP